MAFISPCILPMLPIYLLYLGGSEGKGRSQRHLLFNTLGFIAGFSLVFVALGAGASALGGLLAAHRPLLQRLSGAVVVLFGLNYLGVLKLGFLSRSKTFRVETDNLSFWSSILFGAAFSFGWTPCLGTFLGTALLLASNAGTLFKGMALLAAFSLGLAVPFFLTALLWSRLGAALEAIKRNLKGIQIVSGALLVVIGLLMIFDLFGSYANLFL